MHYAQQWLVVLNQSEQHSVERHAADERFGAVDGIDDPGIRGVAGIPGGLAVFLADKGVIGPPCLDEPAQLLFRLAVGDGDRRVVGLAFGHQTGLEIGQRHPARLPGCVESKIEERIQRGFRIRHSPHYS